VREHRKICSERGATMFPSSPWQLVILAIVVVVLLAAVAAVTLVVRFTWNVGARHQRKP
jgi:hypothetical protein